MIADGYSGLLQCRLQTNTLLLEGLHDATNEAVWRGFDARFRPIIMRFARRLGLQIEDAADVAQETLTHFVRDYRAGKYDRQRGRLHSWIVGIAKFRIADLFRKRAALKECDAATLVEQLPVDDELSTVWEQECNRAVLDRAMTHLRDQTRVDALTIRAFEMVTLELYSAQQVARVLGLSMDSVYAAKHRCLTQLRKIVSDLQGVYEL